MKGTSRIFKKTIPHLILMSCVNALIVTREALARGRCPLSQLGTKVLLFLAWKSYEKPQAIMKSNQLSKPSCFILNLPRPTQVQKVCKTEIGNPQPCVPDGGTYQQAQGTPHPGGHAPATHFPIPGSLPRGHQHPHQALFL